MLHWVKKKNGVNHDKWGGKFEDGKSLEDCLLHEVHEKTGLILTEYRLRGVVAFAADGQETEYMHLFTASGFDGTLIGCNDCNEGILEQAPKKRVRDLPIWEDDKLFFRLIESPDSPFFSLKLVYQGDSLVRAVLDGKELDLKLDQDKLFIMHQKANPQSFARHPHKSC